MLARLRMSVEQCISNYPEMAKNIFSYPRKQIKGWPKNKHDAKRLEVEIQKVVTARIGEDPEKGSADFPWPEDLCRTYVLTPSFASEVGFIYVSLILWIGLSCRRKLTLPEILKNFTFSEVTTI